ncbi:MAG: hypothetical protein M1819_007323 [Sarea resinae]|nr:MAG: hypothetical protein M1819_007323 [Sarea resinae]
MPTTLDFERRVQLFQRRNTPSLSKITSGVFLGNGAALRDVNALRELHIDAVVSLTDAPDGLWSQGRFREIVPEDRHLFIECLDSPTEDLLVHMNRICDFIDTVLSSGTPTYAGVLIQCDYGISRSSTVVIAYLMRKNSSSLKETMSLVRSRRKEVKPSSNFLRQLQVWEKVGYRVWEDEDGKIPKAEYQLFLDERTVELRIKGLTGNEPCFPRSL